mmetsp:Transcript_149455/g.461392  ORF Transcript_149455/g.461392 Transcript_149455/m.461392 type:complete len:238 (+) Transcript_149455:197-910(+)
MAPRPMAPWRQRPARVPEEAAEVLVAPSPPVLCQAVQEAVQVHQALHEVREVPRALGALGLREAGRELPQPCLGGRQLYILPLERGHGALEVTEHSAVVPRARLEHVQDLARSLEEAVGRALCADALLNFLDAPQPLQLLVLVNLLLLQLPIHALEFLVGLRALLQQRRPRRLVCVKEGLDLRHVLVQVPLVPLSLDHAQSHLVFLGSKACALSSEYHKLISEVLLLQFAVFLISLH